MLLLEKLAASPTDSLTYYAFAEDNYPGGPRRTETDLRYLDIRPFKREYKLGESGDGMEAEGEFTTLAELIARQRFNLNRATGWRSTSRATRTFAEDPLKIAGFEETLVGMTREFTAGVEGIVGERIEPLHAAEESMLAAIAALDHGQNAQPRPHGVALRHLIDARNTLRIIIASRMTRVRRGDATASTACRRRRSASPRKTRKRPKRLPSKSNSLPRTKISSYGRWSAITTDEQKGQQKNDEKTVAGNDDNSGGPNENKRREATDGPQAQDRG